MLTENFAGRPEFNIRLETAGPLKSCPSINTPTMWSPPIRAEHDHDVTFVIEPRNARQWQGATNTPAHTFDVTVVQV